MTVGEAEVEAGLMRLWDIVAPNKPSLWNVMVSAYLDTPDSAMTGSFFRCIWLFLWRQAMTSISKCSSVALRCVSPLRIPN